MKVLGTENAKKLKTNIGNIHRDIYTLHGFDIKNFEKVFGDLFKFNQELVDLITLGLPGTTGKNHYPYKYMRSFLCLCSICIKNGYHSVFHQFSLLHHCPFHNIPLLKKCPSCNMEIIYNFSETSLSHPFVCKCTYELMKTNAKIINLWSNNPPKIISSNVFKKWLYIDKTKLQHLENIFPYNVDKEARSFGIEHILSTFNLFHGSEHKHNKIKSSKSIFKNMSLEEIEFKHYYSKKGRYRQVQSEEMERDRIKHIYEKIIYPETNKVITSIARHYRKTVLKDHINCIKRFNRDSTSPPFCPYAIAYLYWRRYSQNYRFVNRIDASPNLHEQFKRYDIVYPPGINYVHSLEYHWEELYENIFNINFAALLWPIKRVIGHIVMNDFKSSLTNIESYLIGNKLISLPEKKLSDTVNLPFFLVIIPPTIDVIEFHSWLSFKKKYNYNNDLKCPFKGLD